ncbi:N-ethylammeline chlorohydrolase, partial [Candidatus Falkowbacteria bacterium]
DELINVSAQPHSIYTCSKETLLKTKKIAEKYNLPIHIHISEARQEVENSFKKNKKSPVKYLDDLGLLSGKTIAAHSVWLNDEDLVIYKKRDVKVSHNPISNMKLASGIAPVNKMQEMKITVGLGTDGAASNNTLDLFDEMKVCALLHKVDKLDPTALSAREVVRMSTIDAARVLGMEDIIGSLEVGKRADIISINLDKPHLTPIYDPYSHIVYSANSGDVENVVINGKIIVRNRKSTTMNEEKILKKVNEFKIKN